MHSLTTEITVFDQYEDGVGLGNLSNLSHHLNLPGIIFIFHLSFMPPSTFEH